MGGRLAIDVTVSAEGVASAPIADVARRVARRVDAWAGRLTRFDEASELMRLNRDPHTGVVVGPTLARVLKWAREASARTDGLVDATLLAERLAVETGQATPPNRDHRWDLMRRGRGAVVLRGAGVGLDLDGVAKGWLADRALGLLGVFPGASVDADGDIAIRVAAADAIDVGIADPRAPDHLLAVVRLDGRSSGASYGVATSGTSVHRWPANSTDRPVAHHLIDPRTGRPAVTDLVQATVVAGTAASAEALAKSAVILGLQDALPILERRAVAAVLLTTAGSCIATPESLRWLVAA
jgi:thiamine biosynthesis lipoprotein